MALRSLKNTNVANHSTGFRMIRFMKTKAHPTLCLVMLLLTACTESASLHLMPTPIPTETYVPIATTTLKADGPKGEKSLDLIYAAFGRLSAETPGRYVDDHVGVDHIFERTDPIIGDHFVFTLHRDLDGDRGKFGDRQRNEIKVHNASDESLKGYKGTKFHYKWKFKILAGTEFSVRASHVFQLKMKDGIDSSPIATITIADVAGVDQLQLRYTPDGLKKEIINSFPLSSIEDEWLQVNATAYFAHKGQLQLSITRLSDSAEIMHINQTSIDMWRTIKKGKVGYVRPKWGFYRFIVDRENLRADEEQIYFADFEIQKIK